MSSPSTPSSSSVRTARSPVSSAHEVEVKRAVSRRSRARDFELEADLVLLAMGFVGPEKPGLLTDLGVDLNERGNVARSDGVDHQRRRRVRRRRHGPRSVADRVGHRRGSLMRGGSRPIPRGSNGASRPDHHQHHAAALTLPNDRRGRTRECAAPFVSSRTYRRVRPAKRRVAAAYSAARSSTMDFTGVTPSMRPRPWPAAQMFFHRPCTSAPAL